MQNALRFFARHAMAFTAASIMAAFIVAPFASTAAEWALMAAPALFLGLAAASILALQNAYEMSLTR